MNTYSVFILLTNWTSSKDTAIIQSCTTVWQATNPDAVLDWNKHTIGETAYFGANGLGKITGTEEEFADQLTEAIKAVDAGCDVVVDLEPRYMDDLDSYFAVSKWRAKERS